MIHESETSPPSTEPSIHDRATSGDRGVSRSDFVIGVLSVTAVVLLVSLLLVQSTPRTAMANGMASYGGNYVMGVGTLTLADEDVLYVIENSSQKMIAYRFDPNKNQINIMQGIDLGALRGNRAAAPAPANSNPATGNAPSPTPRNQRSSPKPKSPPAQPANPPTP